jgi:cytochrome P450
MATASVFDQVLDQTNRADPYPLYRRLRETPVVREADGSYVVSRYRDIVALLHDPGSAPGTWYRWPASSPRIPRSTTTSGRP